MKKFAIKQKGEQNKFLYFDMQIGAMLVDAKNCQKWNIKTSAEKYLKKLFENDNDDIDFETGESLSVNDLEIVEVDTENLPNYIKPIPKFDLKVGNIFYNYKSKEEAEKENGIAYKVIGIGEKHFTTKVIAAYNQNRNSVGKINEWNKNYWASYSHKNHSKVYADGGLLKKNKLFWGFF